MHRRRTARIPWPAFECAIVTGTFRARVSHAASSMVLGESGAPSTVTERRVATSSVSKIPATWIRHSVRRVQARSVSPSWWPARRAHRAGSAADAEAVSVIRRWARRPSAVAEGTSGGTPGHHATMGASGRSSPETSDSSAWAFSPAHHSTTTSEAPASPPTRISASRRVGAAGSPRARTMMRHGCSNEAALAAWTADSMPASSVLITSVRTRPRATTPLFSRSCVMRLATWEVVVSCMRIFTGASSFVRRGP